MSKKTVEVPLPVLLDLDDELGDVADLVRLAGEIGRVVGTASDRLDRAAALLGVEPVGIQSGVDEAALTDLGTAPETLLAMAQERLARVRALVGVVKGR